jgi:S1-C subfamily serine protease
MKERSSDQHRDLSPATGMAQSAGISFAIPINMALGLDELLATGRVPRPGIGVTTTDSPATVADPSRCGDRAWWPTGPRSTPVCVAAT